MERKQRRVPNTRQQGFAFDNEASAGTLQGAPATRFQDADPRDIMLGQVRLDEYLGANQMAWIVQLRELLRKVDVSELMAEYRSGGKPPFHPHVILGLITYGICLGLSSLRELEQLARRDLGAWWMCGGLQPDHSTIGRFVVRHDEALTKGLFESVTRQVLRHVALPTRDVAGDGTVIQAAASRYKLLAAEAAAANTDKVEARLEGRTDTRACKQREAAQTAAQVAKERSDARAAKGQKSDALVAPSEPDAVVQKQKGGGARPSYKPSVLANEHRFILAQTLHPSSENSVVESLVEQAERTLEHSLPTLSLDAGYFCLAILMFCLQHDIDILCPSGRLDGDGEVHKKGHKGKFPKSRFRYDETRDVYICPAEQQLSPNGQERDFRGHLRTSYRASSSECDVCPLRAQCTTAKYGRTIKRYEGEEVADAMRLVMEHPAARRRYRKRQASVEPVFSVLRGRGLTRFRRRGRGGAAVEFALHCIAYNLQRAVVVRAAAFVREDPGSSWHLIATWTAIFFENTPAPDRA